MITVHATEAASSATNINRVDWINGATELVLSGQVQYGRSTRKSKEAFISLENVMEDVMGMDSVKVEVMEWLSGAECCDSRDNVRAIVIGEIQRLLSAMADDFEIGAE